MTIHGCRFAHRAAAPTGTPRLLDVTRESVAFIARTPDGLTVFACIRGQKARRIGQEVSCPLDCHGIRSVELSGQYVAYERLENGSRDASDFDRVEVRDLATGVAATGAPTGGYSRVLGDPPYEAPLPGTVTDLVVTSAGTVAWIAQNESGPANTFAVWVHQLGRPASELDVGANVAPGSLAAAQHRLYWTDADVPRSMSLMP